MKTKLHIAILFLACFNLLRSQTYITSSNSIICVGESATLTANHDFLHNWCVWTIGPSITTETLTVSPTITTTYSVTCYDVDFNASGAIYTQSVSMCTGLIKQVSSSNFQLYPNPTNGIVILNNLDIEMAIEIYNTLGAKVYQGFVDTEKKEIDLNGLKPGIYFIKLKTETQEIIRKIIKQ